MTEYILQKKTLGGWSTVSYWTANEFEIANASFDKCSKGNNGYSWRLLKCEVFAEKRLEEEVNTTPLDEVKDEWGKEANAKSNVWAGQKSVIVKSGGWGDPVNPVNKDVSVTITKPDWGKAPDSWGDHAGMMIDRSKHGMVDKVWLIHHARKDRIRVHANEVDAMLADGWVRGGPRTQFNE